MRIIFSPEARLEFEEAERYYSRLSAYLGKEFRTEICSALPRLQRWPLAFAVESNEIRRLLCSRFPYKLLYSIEVDHIYVIAVAHQHREPNCWVDRISPQ
jgi:plasmid stabilization system protein ParE